MRRERITGATPARRQFGADRLADDPDVPPQNNLEDRQVPILLELYRKNFPALARA